MLVEGFIKKANLPKGKVGVKAKVLGNLVTPATIQMLDEDLNSGLINSNDEICISVVGAGSERGAFITTVH